MENAIYQIMEDAIHNKASDIHLTTNKRPVLRVDGILYELAGFDINTKEFLDSVAKELLTEENYLKFEEKRNIDTSYEYGDTRLRVHIYKQRGANAFSIRLISKSIPVMSQMNLPSVMETFTTLKNGLVLVTGVTGSGKSTTLASIIGQINLKERKHIITIEDPIEYLHEHGSSLINQREVGSDVLSFSDAVRSAMREDPDVVLIGEMRDMDTMSNAITMAETGHLIFGTLHTKSVAETIDRVIDVFPSSQQSQIRIQLANSIRAIVSQELIPKKGGGRVPLCEILIPDDGMRNLIRENASLNNILDHLDMNSKKTGSLSRMTSLVKLYSDGLIDKETVMRYITQTEETVFNNLVKMHQKI